MMTTGAVCDDVLSAVPSLERVPDPDRVIVCVLSADDDVSSARVAVRVVGTRDPVDEDASPSPLRVANVPVYESVSLVSVGSLIVRVAARVPV
jgi:hypothetical protein